MAAPWIRTYRRQWLGPDALAGVSVAAYLIPQVMAYAGVAGLPAVVGLWAAVPALLAYAVAGSSGRLSVGPESTTALMTAAAVGPLAGGDATRYAALSGLLALMVAAWCLAARLARLGFLADLLSRPVLVGYLAGVAVIMVVGQLERLTGVPVEGERVPGRLWSFFTALGQADRPTLIVAAAVLAGLLLLAHRWPTAPGPLIAVVAATAAVALFDLTDWGVEVVGQVPAGFPRPGLGPVTAADLPPLLAAAGGIAVVGYTDNILTARAFAPRHAPPVDANNELLALAVVNAACGLTRGFPVSSSGSRTALAASLGAQTQLHSVVAAGTVVAVVTLGPGLLGRFPVAALGAIVAYAALRMVDTGDLRRLARFRRNELWLALATVAGVVVLDILYGVALALVLSVVEMLTRIARPHDAVLGLVPGLAGMHDIDDYLEAREVPGLLVYRYDAPLFFANADDFRRRALHAVESRPAPVRWFVFNVEANVEVDLTALDALDDLRRELESRGIVFALARVKHDLLARLEAAGLAAAIGPDRMYPTLPTALAAYEAWRRDHAG